MISCWPDGGTQFGVCAMAVRGNIRKSFHIRILEIESHRGGYQSSLSQVAQITSGTQSCNAAWAERRPVVYIARVIRRDTPSGHFAHDLSGVAGAEIEDVVLRRVGAVNVVHRAASDVLPVEVQVGTEDHRQTILGKNIRFVVRNADKVSIVGRGDPGIHELRIEHGEPGRNHHTGKDPAGERCLGAIIYLVSCNPKLFTIRRAGLSAADGTLDTGNKIRERPFHAE